MKKQYEITNSEFEIMQVLWRKKQCGLNEIINELSLNEEKNKNTTKTLIHRLVLKGAIESRKINGKEVIYIPKINESTFLAKESNNFIERFFNGNVHKLLLNFVEDEKVSKEELEHLIEILEDKK